MTAKPADAMGQAGSFAYIRDPDAIYAASFSAIACALDLSGLPEDMASVAARMVHASGMVEIVDALVFSDGAGIAGRNALALGAPILADAEMVASGIIRSRLPANNEILCTLNAPGVAEDAKRRGETRSAVAVEHWQERLAGSVVVIGNAPTALFRLLERLAAGAPKPALIIGLPVGFVGAAESKDALVAHANGVPFITLTGRMGGSAMAAAALNALSGTVRGAASGELNGAKP